MKFNVCVFEEVALALLYFVREERSRMRSSTPVDRVQLAHLGLKEGHPSLWESNF